MAQDDFNFMDLLEDDAWFEAAVRREESVNGEALAGYSWGTHLGAVMANPKGYSHLAQLRAMVLQAWQQLVTEGDLGIFRHEQALLATNDDRATERCSRARHNDE
ncbi:MAG: hypothetical protein AAFX01_09320 [Cyanobacteria bacterium J06638_28]